MLLYLLHGIAKPRYICVCFQRKVTKLNRQGEKLYVTVNMNTVCYLSYSALN